MTAAATWPHSSSDSIRSPGAFRIEQCHTGFSHPPNGSSANGRRSNPVNRRRSGDPFARRSGSSSCGSPNPATKCGSVCSFARPGPYKYRSSPPTFDPRTTFPIIRNAHPRSPDGSSGCRCGQSLTSSQLFRTLIRPVKCGTASSPSCVTAPGHAAANSARSFHDATLDRAGPELSIRLRISCLF